MPTSPASVTTGSPNTTAVYYGKPKKPIKLGGIKVAKKKKPKK